MFTVSYLHRGRISRSANVGSAQIRCRSLLDGFLGGFCFDHCLFATLASENACESFGFCDSFSYWVVWFNLEPAADSLLVETESDR